MRLAEKYILNEWLKNFLFSLTVICFFYILADLFSHIDDLIRNKSGILTIMQFYLFSLPLISIYILVPLATVIATGFCFTNLMRSQEIVALRTSGWNVFVIIRPVMVTLLLISLLFVYFSEVHFGRFMERYQELKNVTQSQSAIMKRKVVENVTYLSGKGRIIYARTLIQNREMEGLLVLDQSDLKKIQAERAVFIEGDLWRLSSVYVHHMASGKIEFFDETRVNIVEPAKLVSQSERFFEMFPTEMIKERIEYFESAKAGELVKMWEVELYKKYAICFFSLILNISIVGMFLKIRKKQNLLSNFGMGLFMSFIFYVTFSIFVALGKAGYVQPLLSVWFVPAIFSLWGILTLFSLL